MSAAEENLRQQEMEAAAREENEALIKRWKSERAGLKRKLTNTKKALEIQLEDKLCSKRALRINLKKMLDLLDEIQNYCVFLEKHTKEDPSAYDPGRENLAVIKQVQELLATREEEEDSDEEDEPDWTDRKFEFLEDNLKWQTEELQSHLLLHERKTTIRASARKLQEMIESYDQAIDVRVKKLRDKNVRLEANQHLKEAREALEDTEQHLEKRKGEHTTVSEKNSEKNSEEARLCQEEADRREQI